MVQGFVADRDLLRRPRRRAAAARRLHGEGLHAASASSSRRSWRPLERLTSGSCASTLHAGQGWKAYAGSLLMLSGVFWLALFLILRTQTLHPWNPRSFHSGTWDVTFNTVSSFVTNTNWQFYGGETTMTYFSQMAGLAVQNFVSAAVGIVVAIALIRAIAHRRGASSAPEDARRLLGRPHPRALLRPAADLDRRRAPAHLPGRHPDARRLRRPQGIPAAAVSSHSAVGLAGGRRGAGHERRRLLQRNSAVCRSENAGGDLELPRALLDPRRPRPRSTATYGRIVGSPPAGRGDLQRDGDRLRRRRRRLLRRRAARHARRHAAGLTRRHFSGSTGGDLEGEASASASPTRRCGAWCHRRPRAAPSTPRSSRSPASAGSSRSRTSRFSETISAGRQGPLLDAAVRPARRLHRRAHGRTHTGVPRQEGRGARDQAGHAGHALHAVDRALRRGTRARDEVRRAVDRTPPARRASRVASTPTSRRPITTARRRRATPGYVPARGRQPRRARHHLRRRSAGWPCSPPASSPILVVLAVPGCAAARSGRPRRPGHAAARHGDLRRAPLSAVVVRRRRTSPSSPPCCSDPSSRA